MATSSIPLSFPPPRQNGGPAGLGLGWAGLGWLADLLASGSSTSDPPPSKVVLRTFVGVSAASCVHPHISSVTGR